MSGAWVVRDQKLCGYIVASYAHSPYAHIITAQKALEDISAVTGVDATNITIPLG